LTGEVKKSVLQYMETPNLNYLKDIAAGDVAFEKNILNLLKDEFPKDYALFNENFNKKKYQEAAQNVHKIKLKISMLGLTEGLEIASHFEKDLKVNDIKLFQEFINVLKKVLVYLKEK
jgi:HPt (histidine-containing phosphotransfer) domain-containing protein